MAECQVCGNDYDRPIEIALDGERHVFDSFECTLHALAPTCEHRGVRVIGHGVQADSRFFCCAHCSGKAGAEGIRDRT